MPFDNIPGNRVAFLDGAFHVPRTTDQPLVMIVGPASKGTVEPFRIGSSSEAEVEFGATSEVIRKMHEVLGQGANNISILRIGGTQGSVVFTTTSPVATLSIIPERRDNDLPEFTYKLIMESAVAGDERILLWDPLTETYKYDSDEIECINDGSIRIVRSTGFTDFTIGDVNDPSASVALADLQTNGSNLTAVNGNARTMTIAITQGTDGTAPTLCERYAALEQAYFTLDYRDADFVLPTGVFVDDANLADVGVPNYGLSVLPTAGSADDALGKVWQYVHQGKPYVYFTESDTAIRTTKAVISYGTVPATGQVTLTAVAAGPAGEKVNVVWAEGVLDVAVSGSTITLTILSGVTTAADLKVAYDLVAAATALAVMTTPGVGALTIGAGDEGVANMSNLVLDGVLKHETLTGDTVPAVVQTAWQNSVLAEYREVNFAHQLATFLDRASVNWKPMLGAISTKAPTAYDRATVASWVGTLPTYTTISDVSAVAAGNNGSGLLGIKFLAGASSYRDNMVPDGASTDGYKGGGFIMTKGTSLPNSGAYPYGILDSDEALDAGGKPVDIGKYLFISYEHPVLQNSFNGGSVYRGTFEAMLVGKLVTLPPNQEPIGVANGRISRMSRAPRIHASQLSDLAGLRMCGTRNEDGVGDIIVNCRTAAHPDSDYTRVSTIRSVAKILVGIKEISKDYVGRPYDQEHLASLKSDLENYLVSQRGQGFHRGADIKLSYTRSQQILGRLTIKLRMVPPFSIEVIETEVSLAADESEL